MFNYLKKHNMRNSLKMLLCLTAICVFSNNAAAKICFLPDGNCGKTKINVNSGENGCIYKTKSEADNGKNECEVSYQSGICWWRRCNTQKADIFDKLADCQKKIEDATSQKCQACGSCYKLVTIPIPPNACPDGYSTKYQSPNDCDDNESFSENGTYNGKVCGACTKTETCPTGYSTQYQSRNDCKSGETFSSNGSVGNLICGKCEKTTDKTCEDMGYEADNCSNSCERAYKTGIYDSEGNECFRCVAYECNKKCSEMNPLWVGEDTGCGKPSGGIGSYYTMEVVFDDALDYITGSDGDCNICHEKRGFDIHTKSSKCYKITSISGEGVNQTGNSYYVPYGTEIVVETQNNDPDSRYCGNAYDDLNINNYRTYDRRTRTFKIDDDFIAKNGIKSNQFDMAVKDDVQKITYTATVYLDEYSKHVQTSLYGDDDYEASFVDISVQMDDASKDSFMAGTRLSIFIDYSFVSYIMDGIKHLGDISSPSGDYNFDGTRNVMAKEYAIDDSCNNHSLYLVNSTRFVLEFQGRQITLKYGPNRYNEDCVQLGTEEDNTQFCYEIVDSDQTSGNNCKL